MKLCPAPNCPNYQPCPAHARKPWAGSRRRERTISGWAQQKRAKWILKRDGTVCHVCDRPCATETDHIVPLSQGGADHESNMGAIHADCHAAKTANEAARARIA